jgi:radical SAM superfamily enzyme YgiQ (UPF0313 family)
MRQTSIPQLSLACMGRLMAEAGGEPELVECMALNIGLEEVLRRVKECPLVFVNTTTPTLKNDMEVVRAIKAVESRAMVGAFGTHVTVRHQEVMEKNPNLDFVIRGEPEETACEVFLAKNAGRGLEDIPGITRRRDQGIVTEPVRPFSGDLDRIARPARWLLPNEQYLHPIAGKPYTIVNVSRGCPAGCIFCVAHFYYGRKLRKRSIESVLHELEEEIETDYVWMYADDLTADPSFLRALCEGILDRGLQIHWWSNTRADVLDQGLYDLMARAGCFMLSVGGESGSPRVLKRACKRIQPEHVVRTVHMLKKARIISLVYFLLGLPGENRKTIKETMSLARRAGPDYVEFYPAIPYPGTSFERTAIQENLITVNDFDRYECGGTDFVLRVEGIEPGGLERLLKRAYQGYYFRLGYVPILLRRLRSLREFAKLIKFGLGYFKRFATPVK